MTRQLLLASRNTKKLLELRRIADALLPDLQVLGLDDVPAYDEVPEAGATFADNALLKAREAVRHTGLAAVGDDSGLTVDALNGMPGVFSARWAGRHGDDRANLDLLLGQLADVPDDRLGAAFVCAAAFVAPSGAEHIVHGEMRGRLVREAKGDHGFGYDPIFVPDGLDVTAAELSAADKDAISHRGHAFRELAPLIAHALAD
ncbi:MAG: RdgB/HAM1 family non-canonical purine NTP pyrophosphatase [Geodermatophilaceae bacterium]|nr:RdgB/HAM1 family non-canonical purine NTP pyrophosphatase [Geodermatophilaceae bacterium]MDQ3465532.1 RdgB/HAM1 family non-canonical purine NTP pyrophosphatase [Actinomycetota bacterium]